MIHDVRIVRLDSQHHRNELRPWMGDSIGRYEGDTLVVETTGYQPHQTFYGTSEALKVTERFTRVRDDRLLYPFRVEDPLVWDEASGGEHEFWASPGIYEYACHEGGHGRERANEPRFASEVEASGGGACLRPRRGAGKLLDSRVTIVRWERWCRRGL